MRTFERLRAQTAAESLEVVLVGCDGGSLEQLAAEGAELAAVRVVACDRLRSTGHAFADGFRAATAPLIVCAEEHSYPEPGWAEAYIEAFERRPDAVAVGAALGCENPATAVSWAHLLSDFGPAVGDPEPGWADELPGHHTAYRRELLDSLGEQLAAWLEIEWILHEELRSQDRKLWLEPSVRVSHANVSLIRSAVLSEYQAGRSFGALGRSCGNGPGHAGSPSPPRRRSSCVVRMWRTGREAARAETPVPAAALVATMLLGLIVNVAGQAVGALAGIGDSRGRRLTIEVERYKHMRPAERRRYEPPPFPARGASAVTMR